MNNTEDSKVNTEGSVSYQNGVSGIGPLSSIQDRIDIVDDSLT